MEKKFIRILVLACLALILSGCAGQADSGKDIVSDNSTELPGPDHTDGTDGAQTDVSSVRGQPFGSAETGIQGSLTVDRPTFNDRSAIRRTDAKSYVEAYDKPDATLASLYHACSLDSTTLAIVMSAFPKLVYDLGIVTESSSETKIDPDELYEAITCCAHSGETREALLECLEQEIWDNPEVETKFSLEKERIEVFCPFTIDKLQSVSPINTAIAKTQISDDQQYLVTIKVPYTDDGDKSHDAGTFNMSASFYRLTK